MRIGVHTDNYRLESKSLEYCLESIAKIGAEYTELNMLWGFDFFEGLRFIPNISLYEDPFAIRELVEKYGLKISCLDAHYPIWSYRCVEYMRMAVLFADQMGVDAVATTDSDELPEDMNESEAFAVIKHHLGEVLKFADRHKVSVCLEPHGQLTNDPEKMKKLVNCHNSDYLRINFDTGNSYVAGWQPQEFLAEVIDKVHHCHVKDVAPELSDESRGEETGIISSDISVGEGANAGNIVECLKIFKKHDFQGVLSLECGGEVLSRKSFDWLSKQVALL